METPTQAHHFDSTDVQRNFDRRLRAEREAAVAEERRRFAVELHDVVAGWLQAAVLHLTEARQSLHEDDARALELLKVIEQEVRGCWDDARRSAAALRPADLDRRGLAGALAEYVSRVSDASAVAIAFNTFGTPRPLRRKKAGCPLGHGHPSRGVRGVLQLPLVPLPAGRCTGRRPVARPATHCCPCSSRDLFHPTARIFRGT